MSNKIELYKEYLDSELKYSKVVLELAEKIKNPLIKALLKIVSEDSVKHSYIYEALIELNKLDPKMITEEEYMIIKEELDKHIEIEETMTNNVKKLIISRLSEIERFLLEGILRDEETHHRLLTQLRDIIAKNEVLIESGKWERVWRKSLYRE